MKEDEGWLCALHRASLSCSSEADKQNAWIFGGKFSVPGFCTMCNPKVCLFVKSLPVGKLSVIRCSRSAGAREPVVFLKAVLSLPHSSQRSAPRKPHHHHLSSTRVANPSAWLARPLPIHRTPQVRVEMRNSRASLWSGCFVNKRTASCIAFVHGMNQRKVDVDTADQSENCCYSMYRAFVVRTMWRLV